MLRRPGHFRIPLSVHSVMLWLATVAFVCRAFMPLGYMPDTTALRNGQLVLTLCTAGGGVSFLSLNAADNDPQQDVSRGDSCPYGMMSEQALMAPGPDTLHIALPTAAKAVFNIPVFATLPPMPPLGPPLGSRAPPYHLS
ncbi:DUF2946 family protein [Pusillimonas sp. ANT_WB101]|uniref:DUF2946 family protein n=1 Tax=Pusillimonas sp. ANT_WB101 TaxID=2597356 RepID=UPI0011ED60A1|nr:DUF2946 family protein [Pusillimonas sp. ANT_WB101]KAA0889324.1 DUF2946 domain-containing protein [Pusillimonas sp. ANT_WB101]